VSDGRMLAGSTLATVLKSGRVFHPDTVADGNIGAVSYDLRLAAEHTFVTGDPKPEPGGGIFLKPGESAFVCTMERAQFAWDVAGIISAPFSLSSRGLLILHGQVVDPGYGLRLINGGWVPCEDTRLHLVFANVGGREVTLAPGETVASLQLFDVEALPPAQRREIVAPTPGRPLAFFSQAGVVLQSATRTLRRAERQQVQIDKAVARVTTVERGSSFVVTFGVFLVTVTLLGVVLTLLLQTMINFPKHPPLDLVVTAIVGGAVVALGTLAAVAIGLMHLARMSAEPQFRATSSDASAPGETGEPGSPPIASDTARSPSGPDVPGRPTLP